LNRANFRERSAPDIFSALSDTASIYQADRYNTSKLLEIMAVRELAQAITNSGKPFVIINTVNPGYCISELQRNAPPILYFFLQLGALLLARTTEIGSRTLFAGAVAGEESHGMYMSECKVKQPSAFVSSEDGAKSQKKVYEQLLNILEGVVPGISKII
jgi:NAD(P)-dependent dehydrogenase (short-subunit alcohol dehydrogenase family)